MIFAHCINSFFGETNNALEFYLMPCFALYLLQELTGNDLKKKHNYNIGNSLKGHLTRAVFENLSKCAPISLPTPTKLAISNM